MNLEVEPPEKKKTSRKKRTNMKKKKDSSPPSPSPSFSLLPDEITENFLARISRSQYPTLSIVSKSFRSVLSSTEIYAARYHLGNTEQCLYICLFDFSYKRTRWFRLWINPNRTRPDSMAKKKKEKKTTGRLLVPIPCFDLPSLATHTAVAFGSEIYVIGGPAKEAPSSAVRVLDCGSHTWRDAPSMNVARKHARACVYDGKIYVMGGCRGLEEDQPWGEVFDTETQTWEGLTDPGAKVREWTIHNQSIAEMEGKIIFGDPNHMHAYDTRQGKWESGKGSFATLPSSNSVVMENVCYSYGRKVRFGRPRSYGCWWYDVKDGGCKEVKGLGSLGDLYKRNGGSNGHAAKVVSCDGKLLVIWEGCTSPSDNHEGMMKIWCAQIVVEKRDGGEVWGNVEWVDAVQTVPIGLTLLHCLVVSV